jgi:ferric-dicitrate binding protein FerR (iron transport regulator)
MMVALAGALSAQDATTQAKETTTSDEQTQVTTAAQPDAKAQTAAATHEGAVAGDSHVRIVRLSEAQGTLAMDRGTGKGYEQTMQNMPIVEGAKLQTDDGYAEVEFEDGSTLRLTLDSRVVFSQLVLHGTGVKATTVNVERGTVYVNLENSKDNEFTVKAGQATLAIAPATHMRLEITWPKMVVSVYGGNVAVQSGGATTALTKKESATLDATDASKVEMTKKIAEAAYDGWDKNSNDYHSRYMRGNAFAGGGNSFGLSDLNYYGSFSDGGCGMMWQPYFTSAAWSPYSNGAWAWYQGAGYSWVSPYPWGWLPYHSGSWSFCQGMGWGWQPGGSWMGLANYSAGVGGAGVGVAGAALPGRNGLLPVPPAGPMRGTVAPASTLVLSNARPLVMSKESQAGNFVFQKDSACRTMWRIMGRQTCRCMQSRCRRAG